MRVGIVGAGLQGNRRAQGLQGIRDAELVVVTAKELEGATQLAARMQCEAAAGWDIVRRSDIDAIVICTPPDIHAEIALAAIAEGKHVLCEKPLSRTVTEGEAMINAARDKGVVLKCGFNHRHHQGIMAAKKRFDAGDIGAPIFLRSTYGICGRPGYEKEWRADPKVVAGGQLMEQGIHVIDLFRWFLTEIADVTAVVGTCYWPIAPLEDNAFVTCRTRTGIPASLHSSLTQWKNIFSYEIYGTEGYLAVEGLGGGYGTERLIFGTKTLDRPFAYDTTEFRGGDNSWRNEWMVFAAAISERATPIGDGRDGLEALRVVLAAYEAARTGARVRLISAASVDARSAVHG
jgi:predicted dehydrogenase